MDSLEPVRGILRRRGDVTLSKLLESASVEFESSGQFGSHWHSDLTTAEIYAPFANYEAPRALSPAASNRILEAMLELWPPRERKVELNEVVFRVDQGSLDQSAASRDALSAELDWLSQTLIAVATGGPRIDSVNAEYQRRVVAFAEQLRVRDLQNPIPFDDLCRWYSKWSGDLPTYQSRRDYIHGLVAPLKQRLNDNDSWAATVAFEGPTGWTLVDRQMQSVRNKLNSAATEEDFQAVGLVCRETLISVAQAVFDAELHTAPDAQRISESDYKGMLNAYLSVTVRGRSNETTRKYTKAAVDLANGLQHRGSATFRDAPMCAEATASVVGFIAAVAGRREPASDLGGARILSGRSETDRTWVGDSHSPKTLSALWRLVPPGGFEPPRAV